MKKLLLINGGLRIGDTFHMLPWLYKHKDFEITWITGTYEYLAVKFLQKQYPNIVEIKTIEDGLPMDIKDRYKFTKKVNLSYDEYKKYDIVESNINLSFDVNPTIYQKDTEYLPNIQPSKYYPLINKPYICYQADSVSAWKHMDIINQYKLPNIDGISIGKKGERVVPGTTDMTGLDLSTGAQLIKDSILFVGIHSAMSCLNFYLNHPGIVLHFTSGLLKFSKYNNKIIDVLK